MFNTPQFGFLTDCLIPLIYVVQFVLLNEIPQPPILCVAAGEFGLSAFLDHER